ncbi:hypothetical protein BCV70DRAFT_59520 [Testicularia cyperi]|uniref:Uncharacterized protein n=1 Tax=Testicularia cyperi TaxID=1882483 RepID=A0A317XVB9_9BASI|nr:hypothetical protein BCV70DRAFT_59520 [Testicularia cyperi]
MSMYCRDSWTGPCKARLEMLWLLSKWSSCAHSWLKERRGGCESMTSDEKNTKCQGGSAEQRTPTSLSGRCANSVCTLKVVQQWLWQQEEAPLDGERRAEMRAELIGPANAQQSERQRCWRRKAKGTAVWYCNHAGKGTSRRLLYSTSCIVYGCELRAETSMARAKRRGDRRGEEVNACANWPCRTYKCNAGHPSV